MFLAQQRRLPALWHLRLSVIDHFLAFCVVESQSRVSDAEECHAARQLMLRQATQPRHAHHLTHRMHTDLEQRRKPRKFQKMALICHDSGEC